ncbi:type VII secretion target [Streptomyces sp. NPDC088785]|uniref:type VII secretion target n=1 Tax=Streptomyces sp. NPDC088785 TaxID=3365897 RepID=UPI003811A25B
MSNETHVDPAELRASAKAADALADDLKGPADKAVKESDTAGGSLSGWAFGSALQEVSTSWKPALDGLRARVRAGAANLRASADGHEWNDERTGKDFENLGATAGTGADTPTARSAPGAMPAPLRRTPDSANTSTHEGSSADTRPAAGANPFG